MLADPVSRRAFLAASTTAFAAAWLAADPAEIRAALEHAARATRSTDPLPWDVLTPEQAADLDAIAAQIFPTDDTPGAREARVVNLDRKSTRLNSSHLVISYAVFCLKKKKKMVKLLNR